jgi:hypothetical protein
VLYTLEMAQLAWHFDVSSLLFIPKIQRRSPFRSSVFLQKIITFKIKIRMFGTIIEKNGCSCKFLPDFSNIRYRTKMSMPNTRSQRWMFGMIARKRPEATCLYIHKSVFQNYFSLKIHVSILSSR